MTTPNGTERISIDGPVGPLEVLIEQPQAVQAAAPLCVICHPHPQYGGTLDNKVVYTLARAALELGATAVRFNFRGVGHSAGVFGQGIGEVEDLLAVVAHARASYATYPVRPLHLAGFSFGAAMAWRGHDAAGAASLLLVAPPAGMGYLDQQPAPTIPWQVIHGSRDQLIELVVLQRWLTVVAGAAAPLRIIEDADHFFHGRLTPLRETASAFWGPLLGVAEAASP